MRVLGDPAKTIRKMKMRVLVDLAKIAITWQFGHFGSRFFAPKSSPVVALEVHTN